MPREENITHNPFLNDLEGMKRFTSQFEEIKCYPNRDTANANYVHEHVFKSTETVIELGLVTNTYINFVCECGLDMFKGAKVWIPNAGNELKEIKYGLLLLKDEKEE